MDVFVDEYGSFDPLDRSQNEICAVMGVIIPRRAAASLEQDFAAFLRTLPLNVFTKNEPKRGSTKPEHCQLLTHIISAHPAVMLVPLTLPIASSNAEFLGELPRRLKEMFHREAHKYLRAKRLSQIMQWADRSGNLSPTQWFRLASYAEALFRARAGIAKFYQCPQFISEWKSVRVTFDRVGRPGCREELVLDLLPLFWEMMRVDTPSPYRDDLKSALECGCPLPKFGNLKFADSRSAWQLQLVDLLVKAWANTVRDYNGSQGQLQQFRLFHQNTVNPPEDALGMVAFRPSSGNMRLPKPFEIFPRIASGVEKILPCGPAGGERL